MRNPVKSHFIWTIVINLGLLIIFKYSVNFGVHDLIAPLGISFYSFAALGYVIDVAKKKYPAIQNPLHLAAGLSFFPCLVSGPIARQNKLVPQIVEGSGLFHVADVLIR